MTSGGGDGVERGLARFGFRRNLLRAEGEGSEKVSFVELFFDLVFVFAITEISHTLVVAIEDGRAIEGAVQAILVLLAVWWVWVYTAWATNWLDTETGPVRVMLVCLLVVGIVMSTSIPAAFEDRALLFVTAYVLMQVGRGVFVIAALARFNPSNALNVVRLTIWFLASGVFWFAGAIVEDVTTRMGLWGLAVLIEYAGPRARFWIPALGSSAFSNIPIRGAHIAERAGLFVIIAIGESILVTGTAFTKQPIEVISILAFASAIAGSILLWLLYFTRAESGGSQFIQGHGRPSEVASNSYTYIHIVLVAGLVAVAVADELVLAHPTGATDVIAAGFIYGAPALYLLGVLLFKHSVGAPWLKSHAVGAVALVAIGGISSLLAVAIPPVGHSWIANGVLAVVVIAEELGDRRRVAEHQPSGAEVG